MGRDETNQKGGSTSGSIAGVVVFCAKAVIFCRRLSEARIEGMRENAAIAVRKLVVHIVPVLGECGGRCIERWFEVV